MDKSSQSVEWIMIKDMTYLPEISASKNTKLNTNAKTNGLSAVKNHGTIVAMTDLELSTAKRI